VLGAQPSDDRKIRKYAGQQLPRRRAEPDVHQRHAAARGTPG
jgi:hypothetical protein